MKLGFLDLFCFFCLFFENTTILYLFILLKKFIYLNWRLITLQYCSGFCHTLTWISHGCTCVPHPEPPSHLPPHPIPLGHPSAPALSTLSHASNLDWRSVSHMIIYMFQCYWWLLNSLTVVGKIQFSVDCWTKGLSSCMAVDQRQPSFPCHGGLSTGQC